LRFSLVVMTYQRPEALRRCLDSIARLACDRDAFEVIVVDDGSAERPRVPLAEAYPDLHLRYHWIRHQGVAAARNAGLALARAELVAFLADDYILPPDYLARAERFFQDYPDARVITFNVRSVGPGLGCQVQQLYHELVLLQNAAAEPDRNGIIRTFKLPASRAAVFRRELLTRVGGFDPRLSAGEDGELGHEGKGFRDFLRQRREYATSYFAVTAAGRADAAGLTWTLARCARVVAERLGGWVGLSRREGKLLRFALLWPGLALFLLRFYLTLHHLERAARRIPVAVTAPSRAQAKSAVVRG
jgi:glycosyltransferase involved in cell wall biosynthesis